MVFIVSLKVHMSAAEVLSQIDSLNWKNNGGEESVENNSQLVDGSEHTRIGNMELEIERQSMIDGNFHPLVRTHPVTGERVWFNQADQWHPTNLDEDTRAALSALLDEAESAG